MHHAVLHRTSRRQQQQHKHLGCCSETILLVDLYKMSSKDSMIRRLYYKYIHTHTHMYAKVGTTMTMAAITTHTHTHTSTVCVFVALILQWWLQYHHIMTTGIQNDLQIFSRAVVLFQSWRVRAIGFSKTAPHQPTTKHTQPPPNDASSQQSSNPHHLSPLPPITITETRIIGLSKTKRSTHFTTHIIQHYCDIYETVAEKL